MAWIQRIRRLLRSRRARLSVPRSLNVDLTLSIAKPPVKQVQQVVSLTYLQSQQLVQTPPNQYEVRSPLQAPSLHDSWPASSSSEPLEHASGQPQRLGGRRLGQKSKPFWELREEAKRKATCMSTETPIPTSPGDASQAAPPSSSISYPIDASATASSRASDQAEEVAIKTAALDKARRSSKMSTAAAHSGSGSEACRSGHERR